MNEQQQAAMKMALEALLHLQPTALTSFYTIGDRDKAITALRQALEQQPAQYSDIVSDGGLDPRNKFDVQQPAAPQRSEDKKQWVGLTQQDIDIAFDDTQEGGGFNEFARAIEQRLKEKNT